MCNRYSSTKNEASLSLRNAVHHFLLTMRYSIAPTQKAPVTRKMSNSRYILPDCIERIFAEEKQPGLL
jgi:hypothetical protein